jgi:hypothetical protein
MKIQKYLLLFSITLFANPTLAEKNRCVDNTSYLEGGVLCQCGSVLSNLKVTIPKGTRLERVCSLRYYPSTDKKENNLPSDESGPTGSYPLDLKHSKASLDDHKPSGDYPIADIIGGIEISGELILSGIVVVNPSDAGIMFFDPAPKQIVFPRETVFTKKFRQFKLGKDDDLKHFKVTKEILKTSYSECWEAKAKIKLRGIRVEISEQDSAGTYAHNVKVLSLAPWKKCTN